MRHTYVHVPFCARRCSYCDFAITVARGTPDARFVSAILAERELRRAQGRWTGEAPESLYFGGGTPSRLGSDSIADLIAELAPGSVEVTVEANPEDVTAEKAAGWQAAGVNRVSLGAQSFDPAVLAWMHRTHDVPAIARAIATLRDAGLANISLDLIFGLPDSLDRDFERDLDAALELQSQHLSVYGLSVEPRTPLSRWIQRGETPAPSEDRYVEGFLATHRRLTAAGFEHYEVSNYAQPGRRSRHNSAYWLDRPYIGLGPAAHSYDGRERSWNAPAWVAYERTIRGGGDPTAERETLSPAQRSIEMIYLNLRTDRGLSLTELPIEHASQLKEWEKAGWLMQVNDNLRLTADGWLRLDEIVTVLTT